MEITQSRTSVRSQLIAMMGNILGHYDRALFGLLAPFIAPLFFDDRDPLAALMKTYAIMPLGVITKPLGSLFFGWIGDRLGRRSALCYSLLGMAFVTVLIGCLPTYCQMGVLAPCLLALGRMLQNFCAAGESTGASIFVMEQTLPKFRSVMSSFYDLSSMSGIAIASGFVTILSMQGWADDWWRIPFWIGGSTAFFGVYLRFKGKADEIIEPEKRCNPFKAIRAHWQAFLSIMLASGFSYATYSLAFTLMNGYVPLVTSLAKADVMKVNTGLLFIDMLLLPCFGYLAHRFGTQKVMFAGALCSAIGAIPLFYCLEGSGIVMVTVVRCLIVIFGVAFAAPYHAWKLECVPPEHRSTVLSLGCALGCQVIGSPTAVIGLWLYQQLGVVWAPGLYLLVLGALACIVVRRPAYQVASS